jgi:hypothetical protein
MKVTQAKRADGLEAVLREADATIETWFLRSKRWGAAALRQRLDDLQGGLKRLSARLERVDVESRIVPASVAPAKATPDKAATIKVGPAKRRPTPRSVRKPASPRKRKKAA